MNAQTEVVSGKIVAFYKIPIEKAEIIIKKSKIKVLTDSLGGFKIPCKINDKLVIMVAGFKTKKVVIESLVNSLTINLEFGGSEKDFEAAIINGHVEEKTLKYETDYLDAERFDDLGYTNALEMLSGKFPGVTIVNNQIRMRGTASLYGSNAALIVLDGVITSINTLKALHASLVKNIKVLKGPQAAIYGSRGANGVVLVTTKGK